MPIISGNILDYMICFLSTLLKMQIKEKDYESVFIFLSILNNMLVNQLLLRR